ncbi:MAG: MFS transporter [Opitutales bacterium]
MAKPLSAPGSSKRSLGTIFLVVFLDLVGFSIIFPLFPAMLEWYLGREGEASLLGQLITQLEAWTPAGENNAFLVTVLFGGVLGSLYSLLQFACAPLWGRLSDRIGRRRVLLFTVAGTALSYLVWVFSGDFVVLLLARVLGGIMAGNIAVATAAVADVTSRENRSRGMALIGVAFGLGFVAGPALGGLASLWNPLETLPGAAAWGLHPFSFPAACALVLALVNWVWVARSFPETRPTPSAAPVAVEAAGERRGWFSFLTVRNQRVGHAIAVYFVLLVAFSAMEFSLTFLAVERFAYSPRDLTGVFLFVGLVLALTQGWFVRRYAGRIGETRCVVGGLVAGALGLAALGLAQGAGLFYGGLALLGIGIGVTSPTLSALVSLYADPTRQGAYLGAFRSAGALARAVGPLLGAVLYWGQGSTTAYLAGAACLVLALLLALPLPKPEKEEPAAP